MSKNYSHWIMTSNDSKYIPIETGDTRIVMWGVSKFKGAEIPKFELLEKLRMEAPFFIRKLHNLNLSNGIGRHTLPVLATEEKTSAIGSLPESNVSYSLAGKKKQAADAIVEMPKPFSGPASALGEVLGDWDGEQGTKELSNRASSLGICMPTIKPYLDSQNVNLEIIKGKNTTYSITDMSI